MEFNIINVEKAKREYSELKQKGAEAHARMMEIQKNLISCREVPQKEYFLACYNFIKADDDLWAYRLKILKEVKMVLLGEDFPVYVEPQDEDLFEKKMLDLESKIKEYEQIVNILRKNEQTFYEAIERHGDSIEESRRDFVLLQEAYMIFDNVHFEKHGQLLSLECHEIEPVLENLKSICKEKQDEPKA